MTNEKLESAAALRKPVRRGWSWLAVLGAGALFLLLCLAHAQLHQPEAPVRQQAAQSFVQLIPDGAGKPEAVTITSGGAAFTLTQDAQGYHFDGEETALDAHAAGELLGSGESILARRRLEGSPAEYGVSEDGLCARFRYADQSDFVIRLGDPVPTGEGWYAAVGDEVYIVNNALARALAIDRMSLYALPALPFTAQTLRRAVIERPGAETIAIDRVTQANPFNTMVELTSPIRYPANSERAAEVYLALEKLQPAAVADLNGTDEAWGLAQPLAVITLVDEETTRLTLGWTDGGYAMRINGESAVYTLAPDALDFLGSLTVPWLAEQLPGLVMLSQVAAIDVHARGETLHFDVDQPAKAYVLNGRPLEEAAFVPAYQQMIGMLIERYLPAPEGRGEARLEIEYTFTDGSRWAIALTEYDEAFDLIVRGDCACFLISREKTDSLMDLLFALQEE